MAEQEGKAETPPHTHIHTKETTTANTIKPEDDLKTSEQNTYT